MLDLLGLQIDFLNFSMHIHKAEPKRFGPFIIGPIPAMVLYAFSVILTEEDKTFVKNKLKELPDFSKWMAKFMFMLEEK
jgi:hypothetical protein